MANDPGPRNTPAPSAPPDGDRRAGTAPVDPTDLVPGVTRERMEDGAAAAAAGAGGEEERPIGGENTLSATAWAGVAGQAGEGSGESEADEPDRK